MTDTYDIDTLEQTVHTIATYRVREMELAQDVQVYTEHNDRVLIPAGTVFKFTELIRFETEYPEDREVARAPRDGGRNDVLNGRDPK